MMWFSKKKEEAAPAPQEPAGPAPWHARGRAIADKKRVLEWDAYGEDEETIANISFLHLQGDRRQITLLAEQMTYWQARGGELLLWHENMRVDEFTTGLRFDLLHVGHLKVMESPLLLARGMRRDGRYFAISSGDSGATFVLPGQLGPGTHALDDVPDAFRHLEEVLALADYTPAGPKDENALAAAPPRRAIYLFNFMAGLVSVLPQDWYNQSSADFKRQWIARAWRDPLTGRITGDGMNLCAFQLDETGRKFDKWLEQEASATSAAH